MKLSIVVLALSVLAAACSSPTSPDVTPAAHFTARPRSLAGNCGATAMEIDVIGPNESTCRLELYGYPVDATGRHLNPTACGIANVVWTNATPDPYWTAYVVMGFYPRTVQVKLDANAGIPITSGFVSIDVPGCRPISRR